MSDAPSYRLYTCKQAAERTGGNLTESLFKRLATSREVEATYISRKIRWTDAQIAAAVAYHARGGKSADATRQTTPSTRRTRTAPAPAPRMPGAVTPLRPKAGARYSGRTA